MAGYYRSSTLDLIFLLVIREAGGLYPTDIDVSTFLGTFFFKGLFFNVIGEPLTYEVSGLRTGLLVTNFSSVSVNDTNVSAISSWGVSSSYIKVFNGTFIELPR